MLLTPTESIPCADPTRIAPLELAAIHQAIAEVLHSGQLILGPFVATFEQAFACFLSATPPHVVAVASGSDALILGIQALELPAGSTVLVAANEGGFASNAILACGLRPKFVDVSLSTRAIDATILDAAWDAQVSAVVITHLHGLQADMQAIQAFCQTKGMAIIEDCAQVHGARRQGIHAGLAGDVSTFSFYPTKNLGCLGDGGAVVTRNAAMAEKIRSLRHYGWGERYRVTLPNGRNSRLDALQAAILTARLAFLADNNQQRCQIVQHYQHALGNGSAQLVRATTGFVAHHAVVSGPNICDLKARLQAHKIQFGQHYPYLTTEMSGLRGAIATDVPHARLLRDTSLSLPCFPTLTHIEIERICEVLQAWSHA